MQNRSNRTRWTISTAAAVLAIAGTALAQGDGVRDGTARYAVEFQEVSNSCSDIAFTPGKGDLVITQSGDRVVLTLNRVPKMSGTLRKGGKFKAEGKADGVAGKDVSGKFSALGRVRPGSVQLIFVAEFYRGKKSLCSRSWDVSGARK